LGSNGNRQGTVAIIVGGVASAQGAWENHVQGEGPQVGPSSGSGWTEVIDLVEPFRSDWTPARECAGS